MEILPPRPHFQYSARLDGAQNCSQYMAFASINQRWSGENGYKRTVTTNAGSQTAASEAAGSGAGGHPAQAHLICTEEA